MNLVTDSHGLQWLDGRFLACMPPYATVDRVLGTAAHLREMTSDYGLTAEGLRGVVPFAEARAIEARGVLDDRQAENAVAVEQRLVAAVLDGMAEGKVY